MLVNSNCSFLETHVQESPFLRMVHDYPAHASPSYPQEYLKHVKKAVVVCLLVAALGGTCILVERQDMGRIAHAKCQMNTINSKCSKSS